MIVAVTNFFVFSSKPKKAFWVRDASIDQATGMGCGDDHERFPSARRGWCHSMTKLYISLLLSIPCLLQAATLVCGPTATGNGSGSDWNNMFGFNSGTLVRGNTYYLRGGVTYGDKAFNVANSGSSLITIKKATADDHVTDTGWNSSYGTSQATLGSSWVFSTSYWVIDGNGTHTVPSDNTSDYGFKVSHNSSASTGGIIAIGTSGNTVSDITIRYVHVYNTSNGSINNGTVGLRFYPGAVQQRIKVQNCFLENSGKDGIQISNSGFILVERCYVKRYGLLEPGTPDYHGQTVQIFYGGSDIVFRWNVWESNEGQSLVAIAGIGAQSQRIRFYGNVVFNKYGQTTAASGGFNTSGGIIGNAWAYLGHNGLYVYNNTVVNVGGTYQGHAHFPMNVPGSAGQNEYGYNNLFYNCGGNVGATGWSDWGYHASGGSSYGGTSEQTGLSSGIFNNYTGNDFRLASATSAGLTLTSQSWWSGSHSFFGTVDSAADMYGNTRGADGTWDRGAFEFGSGSGAGSPPVITGHPVNATVSVGQSATFTVVATGASPLTYQWQRNGANISGATGSAYTTPATTASDSGATFRAVVSNSAGSVPSSAATLTVSTQPNASPTVQITSPSNGANFTSPAAITLEASASDADGSIAKVEFFSGGTKLGEDTSSPYSFNWNGVTAGSYSLTAVATDNLGAATTSSAISLSVADLPPVGQFNVGDRVMVIIEPSLRVRSTPEVAGTILGSQLYEAMGTIISGPVAADGFTWWQVDYDSSPDGWSIEGNATSSFLIVIPRLIPPGLPIVVSVGN